MSDEVIIKVEYLSKVYKIFDKPVDRLKESLNPFHRRYSRDFYALNDVSFEIKRGETVGIIGKNGAGKSTLLKILTGVLTPSSGKIQVNGKVASLLELGAGFNPEMTGIENIYLNGTVMGYSKKEMDTRINNIIEFADIGEFIYQPVKMYSSGMFARLAFAVNAFVEPDILIVDEALSVGDIFFQNKCFKKFEDLRKHGVTILFVSHDMGSIRQLTNKALWLDNGKQIMYSNTDNVCAKYFREEVKQRNKINDSNIKYGKVAIVNFSADEEKKVFPQIKAFGKQIKCDEVEIKSFFLKDIHGEKVTQLKVNNEYIAVLVSKFYKPVNNAIFGFVVENSRGIQILAINSFINNKEKVINITQPCIMETEFRFCLPRICKGDYILSPAIAKGVQNEHITLTWLTGTTRIYVENNGYNLSLLEIESIVKVNRYRMNSISFSN